MCILPDVLWCVVGVDVESNGPILFLVNLNSEPRRKATILVEILASPESLCGAYFTA